MFAGIFTIYCATRLHQIPKLINYVAVPSKYTKSYLWKRNGGSSKKNYTENLMVYSTGLHINAKCPHLGASPDGIIYCDFHGKGLLEIKYPHKYRSGLEDWQDDKDFPLDESGQIKKDHIYHAQVQGQLLILDMSFCHFFI